MQSVCACSRIYIWNISVKSISFTEADVYFTRRTDVFNQRCINTSYVSLCRSKSCLYFRSKTHLPIFVIISTHLRRFVLDRWAGVCVFVSGVYQQALLDRHDWVLDFSRQNYRNVHQFNWSNKMPICVTDNFTHVVSTSQQTKII